MGWPQVLWIALVGSSLLIHANKHGKPKEGRENFWTAAVAAGLHVGLLTWGGFFA